MNIADIAKPVTQTVATAFLTAALVFGVAYNFQSGVHDMVLLEISKHERIEHERDLKAMDELRQELYAQLRKEIILHEQHYHSHNRD